jgi:hypothetical protein
VTPVSLYDEAGVADLLAIAAADTGGNDFVPRAALLSPVVGPRGQQVAVLCACRAGTAFEPLEEGLLAEAGRQLAQILGRVQAEANFSHGAQLSVALASQLQLYSRRARETVLQTPRRARMALKATREYQSEAEMLRSQDLLSEILSEVSPASPPTPESLGNYSWCI